MIEWRRIVMEYPCLTCGSPPGVPCITIGGRYTYTPHQDRSRRASENHWRDPDTTEAAPEDAAPRR